MRQAFLFSTLLSALLLITINTHSAEAITQHAIAMHGEPAYADGFTHFNYVNPDAPKAGTLRRHVIGTFDTFNPFISRGTAAAGIAYLYDSLTVASLDEPFTQYGLLAQSMQVPEDRSWIIYTLRKEARFADGTPVTAHDVVFSFTTLTEKGAPFYSFYYGDVDKVEALDDHRVKFSFKPGDNQELALIIGQMQVLPAHFWKDRDFTNASLDYPMGSGPYRLVSHEPGRQVVYERRDDYWAKNLPVKRGHHNFDRLTFEYFLDDTVALEAFKGGRYDLRMENRASTWASGYDSPALERGDIQLREIHHSLPAGMQGFVYNLRKPIFQDPVLREALAYAYDFEWANSNLFHGQYRRTRSYFQNSEMEAQGLPDEAEFALLEPLAQHLPPRVFTQTYHPPASDASGRDRKNLIKARQMLLDANYTLENRQLISPDGEPVRFQILLDSAAFERIVLPFAQNLQTLGVTADVRRVDPQQYTERLRKFDFDIVVHVFGQSNSPGNEQRDYWHSDAATRTDSRNIAGISNTGIDALVELLIAAPDRQSLVTRARALDRALQWGHYVIPNWHLDYFRVAYHTSLRHPDKEVPYGFPIDTWWHADNADK